METTFNTSDSKTIFILDDDQFYLNFLTELISKYSESITVKCFNNKNDFINNLDGKPDLIILDFNLGYENSNRVTAHSVLNQIEESISNQDIVLLSGEANVDLLEEYNRYRNFDFLVKTTSIKNDLFNLFDKRFQSIVQ
jgi:two-component system, OmpR family, response regulator